MLGVLADHVVLRGGQRGRLLQDRVRHRQLADVVQQGPDGQVAQSCRRQAEFLAHRHRAQRHLARVFGRVGVLLGQAGEQHPYRRPEEGIRRGHKLGRAEVAGQRPALCAAVEIECDRHRHHADSDQLEARARATSRARASPSAARAPARWPARPSPQRRAGRRGGASAGRCARRAARARDRSPRPAPASRSLRGCPAPARTAPGPKRGSRRRRGRRS